MGRSVSASLSSRGGRYIVIALVFLWTIPTFGLLVSSVRPEQEVKTSGWWEAFIRPKFTLSNYDAVLSSSPGSANLSHFFFNSVKITVPAVLLSVGIGAMAAYAFSWMKFKGRDWLFVAVVAMLVVPLQMALIPLLRLITGGAHIGSVTIFPYLHLNNSVAAVWVAHVCFGLPFCIFILKNFMSALPRDIIEAARVDGAGHLTVFTRLVMPLSVPALASLAIFQFMCDLERPADRPRVRRRQEQADHRQAGRGRRHVRPVVAPAHGRRVRLDGGAPAGVLRLAAVLRPRPARRGRQGMTAGASPEALIDQLTIDEQVSLLAGVDFWHTAASNASASLRCASATARPGRAARASTAARRRSTFPCGTALGATWDPDLVERIGQVLGRETKRQGRRCAAGADRQPAPHTDRWPQLRVHERRPLPHVAHRASPTCGVVQSEGVAACIKHFVGNDTEFERMSIDSQIDERTLRELYLVPFEAAVKEAGVLRRDDGVQPDQRAVRR